MDLSTIPAELIKKAVLMIVSGEKDDEVDAVLIDELSVQLNSKKILAAASLVGSPEPKTRYSQHDFKSLFEAEAVISLAEITKMFWKWNVHYRNKGMPISADIRRMWTCYYNRDCRGMVPPWFIKMIGRLCKYYDYVRQRND